MVKEFNGIEPLLDAVETESLAMEREIMENTDKYKEYRQ